MVHYLERVNFTTGFGDRVSFDDNGDALAIYDIMNWVWLQDGSVQVETVGVIDESAPAGQELTLDEDRIFWNFESKKVICKVIQLYSIFHYCNRNSVNLYQWRAKKH